MIAAVVYFPPEKEKDKKRKCTQCDGTGKVWVGRHWYSLGHQITCDYCDGTGFIKIC